jgi:hypothetical protein
MTRGDQAIDAAADKLETFVQEAERQGGVKAKVGEAFAEDPQFLRKLKPSLVAARARGEHPHEPQASQAPPRPPKPPQPQRRGGGPSPWLVLGAAFAVGVLLAKTIDWRGHAHPRW